MNKPIWPYPGSRWWKFDFHTHTPASRDTYWARNNINLSPEEWLLEYMRAEIDCVAVTDHNSGAWIDDLKKAYANMKAQAEAGNPPEGFRKLTIFPGVEISVQGGIHLLAIFEPDAKTGDIDTLLGKVDYNGSKGDSDGVTRKGIAAVLEAILESGAIPIPAHADADKGLLAVRPGTQKSRIDANTVRQALDVEGVLAVEWVDSNKKDYLTCVKKQAKKLTRILGSDCHTFHGNAVPGSRYTWVKMAKPTLDGLRLALLDGNGVSIRRSDEGTFDPFKTPAHFITAIEIGSARYMGNGQAERIELTPFYNALIGGRGTGKSSFVHALRLAYGRNDELNSLSGNAEPLRQFESFRKVPKARDDEGALRVETEICAELMREGQLSRLRWQNPGSPQIIVEEKDANGTWCESGSQAVNPERFPIRLFSQGQIAAMAGESRQALLSVIDEAAQVGKLKREFEEEKRSFLTQRARLRELEGKLADRHEVERRLHEVVRKLDAFAQAHHAEVLKAHAHAQNQRREVEQLLKQMHALPERIEDVARDLILDDWSSGVFDDASDADVLEWRKKADDAVQQVRQALEQASSALAENARLLEQDPLLAVWRKRTDKAQADFEDLQKSLAAQGVNDPQAFGQLVQERQYLEAQLKRLDQIKAERDTLEEAIAAQWQKVVEAREAITSTRAEFVKKTLDGNPYVRIEVVPFGFDARVIERSLRELLEATDDRFENDILAMAAAGNPTGGLAFKIAQADDRKAALDSSKKQLQTIADAFGGHFKNYLKKKLERPEFADHIQCWFPEDDLRIQYSRRADGTDWAALTQGSQGQRSAALLAFLLAFGEEPLVLDQPEDDLDNHLIYDLIVRQIRESKLRRQLVIVTHNPNIVVNGDAELVHVLDFRGGQCRVVERGALQENSVREEVCRVMEGGRDAFERRWKRLGRRV
ncbi:TrlF family AAA-like ATPase [Dissulfurimicrobium hydrothermale]|uniref:TrlF family AAA-like ATPase n=1 Tax=Dissulfurimicrobium hydrothermale TaxID=1750598 RepID=UPI001EDB7F3C|nr:AAA family ATPase [Dissulfurimicrobium hydrothermale]UKL13571.1 AAA family ATPase [Dissulfurimicrobium hydrothermale]